MGLGISCSVCKSVPVDTSISQHTCDVYHSIPVMYITAYLWCISQHTCDVYHSMPVMYITAYLTTCDVASKRNSGGGGDYLFLGSASRGSQFYHSTYKYTYHSPVSVCGANYTMPPPLSKVGGMPPLPPFPTHTTSMSNITVYNICFARGTGKYQMKMKKLRVKVKLKQRKVKNHNQSRKENINLGLRTTLKSWPSDIKVSSSIGW